MQFERGKPPETPNAPYRAARIEDERWRSVGPGLDIGKAVGKIMPVLGNACVSGTAVELEWRQG
jgi:hypothetical protein